MYLFIAGICYLLPFYLPVLWPLLWLFPSFLFLGIQKKNCFSLSIWCSVVSCIHLLPIYLALIAMASGPLWMKLIGPWFFSAYVSSYFFAWLLLAQYKLKRLSSLYAQLFFWTLALWLFLLSLDYLFLWPFGRLEGVPFFNPLLPMAYAPSMLSPLSYLPFPLVLLWYCAITSIICLCLNNARSGMIALTLSIAPWLLLVFDAPKPTPPKWLARVGHLPLSMPSSFSLNAAQTLIKYELATLTKKHPQLQLVIMPESSWNSGLLSKRPLLQQCHNQITDLIIGSFAHENSGYYNCLYWYHAGICMQQHQKRHAIPFAERPIWNTDFLSSKLYFHKNAPLSPSCKPRRELKLKGLPSLIPYICSDFFCNPNLDNHVCHTILLTANDVWFIPHFQKLMVLAARFRAIQWRRPLLYIAYYHAGYFDEYGNGASIATTSSFRSGTFFDKAQKKDTLLSNNKEIFDAG